VVTDNGNFIIDAPFTEDALRKPHEVPFMPSRVDHLTDMRKASRKDQAADRGC
jgi:ribose 5-phosphate isomerase